MSKRFILVKDLSVALEDRTTLSPLSFEIPCGSWLSIIGPNGAGKSTLLKAIAGLIPISSGSITLAGESVAALNQRSRAQKITYVAQRFEAAVPFLIEEFLKLSLYASIRSDPEKQIQEACKIFRIEKFLGRSIKSLSVGELQRVLLAAAFIQGGEVLLLDEPSAALDPYEEKEVVAALKNLQLNYGKTILFVSHNLSVALSKADAVMMLKEGALFAFDVPAKASSQEMLSKLYNQEFIIEQKSGQRIVAPLY